MDDPAQRLPTEHTCHAYGCITPCKPEELMCARHWALVDGALKSKVWRHYRPGQCDDKRPSREWLAAADAAIRCVRDAEERMFAPDPRSGRVPLNALSVRQPWADLIAAGLKGVENRAWAPPPVAAGHLIAIHAGKSPDTQAWGDAYATLARIGALTLVPHVASYGAELDRTAGMKPRTAKVALNRWIGEHATHGAIVAVARIGRVFKSADDAGPWFTGPVGWELTSAVRIEPVPVGGAQYLWAVRGDTLNAVRAAYRRATRGQ